MIVNKYDKIINIIDNLKKKFETIYKNNSNKNEELYELYNILIKLRLLHGKIYVKNVLKTKTKFETYTKKYFTLSLLKTIENNLINTIDHYENIFNKLFNNINDENKLKIKKLINEDFDEYIENEINLDTETIDKKYDKNTLLYLYIPSCSHCVHFMNTWNNLSSHYKNDKNLKLIKFNCEKFDSDDRVRNVIKFLGISGFPSIFFINKEMSKIINYDGEREPDYLINFINTYNK